MEKNYKNKTIAKSFKNAGRGLWFCIKNERNMRIHTSAALCVLVFAPFLEVTRGEYALLFAVIGVMITAEALNTAIEKFCDFVCSKYNRTIGYIKDVAAAAVFVSAICALAVGFVLLFKPEQLLNLAVDIFTNTVYSILFVLWFIFNLIYIFLGPVGIKNLFKKK